MAKKFRRMADSDFKAIVDELDRWALGQLGSKVTWAILEERFGFSRQSLQAKPKIKAAYDSAKSALSSGMVKTKEQANKENEGLLCEVSRLKHELEEYQRKEILWKQRWQRIAFHIRQKGVQVSSVDRSISEKDVALGERDTAKILSPFDKKIPPSGRV